MTLKSFLSTNPSSPKLESKMGKEALIQTIALIINDIIEENEDNTSKNLKNIEYKHESIFIGKGTPSISIEDYLKRIIKYTNLEESTLLICLIYLDRFINKTNTHLLRSNIHRLIISSAVLAIKYNEDDIYDNNLYSRVGGISAQEFCKLELEFVKGLDYNLFVDEDFFDKYDSYIYKFNCMYVNQC